MVVADVYRNAQDGERKRQGKGRCEGADAAQIERAHKLPALRPRPEPQRLQRAQLRERHEADEKEGESGTVRQETILVGRAAEENYRPDERQQRKDDDKRPSHGCGRRREHLPVMDHALDHQVRHIPARRLPAPQYEERRQVQRDPQGESLEKEERHPPLGELHDERIEERKVHVPQLLQRHERRHAQKRRPHEPRRRLGAHHPRDEHAPVEHREASRTEEPEEEPQEKYGAEDEEGVGRQGLARVPKRVGAGEEGRAEDQDHAPYAVVPYPVAARGAKEQAKDVREEQIGEEDRGARDGARKGCEGDERKRRLQAEERERRRDASVSGEDVLGRPDARPGGDVRPGRRMEHRIRPDGQKRHRAQT